MHIGLIGGIGVAATSAYYSRLTAAVAQRGGTLDLTIVHADVDTLIRTNAQDLREEQAKAFQPLLDRLARAGCDCAAITSLGGHFCYEETEALSPLPLVSGVAPLDAFFVAEGFARIGLLGTKRVMQTRLYGQLARTEALILEDELDTLSDHYVTMASAGRANESQRTALRAAGARLIDAGAQAVVLAGTDLSLVYDTPTGFPVVDALDVHVARLADLACGLATL